MYLDGGSLPSCVLIHGVASLVYIIVNRVDALLAVYGSLGLVQVVLTLLTLYVAAFAEVDEGHRNICVATAVISHMGVSSTR